MTVDIKIMIAELAVPEVTCSNCDGRGGHQWMSEHDYEAESCSDCKATGTQPQFPWARVECQCDNGWLYFDYGQTGFYTGCRHCGGNNSYRDEERAIAGKGWRVTELTKIDLNDVLITSKVRLWWNGELGWISTNANATMKWCYGKTPKEAAIKFVYNMWIDNES